RRHDIGHMRPPALHHLSIGQIAHGVINPPPQHAKENVRLFIEMDRIILHPGRVQQLHQLRKNLVMAFFIFGGHARIELHLEGVFFVITVFDHAVRCFHNLNRIGSAMTTISSAPTKMDMTIPGTLSSPSPKVTSPMISAASTTPMIEPDPPRIDTPPSTTMVITSSSNPCAIGGRVEPSRAVSSTAASPLIRPVRQNSTNFIRSTRTPENCAAVALLPMANTRRPKLVWCSST